MSDSKNPMVHSILQQLENLSREEKKEVFAALYNSGSEDDKILFLESVGSVEEDNYGQLVFYTDIFSDYEEEEEETYLTLSLRS